MDRLTLEERLAISESCLESERLRNQSLFDELRILRNELQQVRLERDELRAIVASSRTHSHSSSSSHRSGNSRKDAEDQSRRAQLELQKKEDEEAARRMQELLDFEAAFVLENHNSIAVSVSSASPRSSQSSRHSSASSSLRSSPVLSPYIRPLRSEIDSIDEEIARAMHESSSYSSLSSSSSRRQSIGSTYEQLQEYCSNNDVKVTFKEQEVNRLPVSVFRESSVRHLPRDNPERTCSICQEFFEDGDLQRRLPCMHIFCDSCIVPWLTEQSKKCPIDMKEVIIPR